MAVDNSQSQDVDLDRTDRLPILDGMSIDADVADDAVPLEYTASLPTLKHEFSRPSGVDLPSLAESVRSVEERIARQSAEYDALTRSYDKAREAESAATARAHELAAELAGLRATLDAEQSRSRETDRSLNEKITAAEAARSRTEEALREAERYQAESHTLRDTLATRDAAIAQVLHSLGERDAQLVSLQREHAQIVPALEERAEAGSKLAAELQAARARLDTMGAELKSTHGTVAALNSQLKVGEERLGSTWTELRAMKVQANAYLEQLRTRDWRRGFDHNVFRVLDAQIGASQNDRGALQGERDRLRQQIAELESRLASREESIGKLKTAAAADEARLVKHQKEIQQIERERSQLADSLAAVENDRGRLNEVLAAQHDSIAKLNAAAAADEAARTEHEAQLQSLDVARAGLLAQIKELDADRQRLAQELAAKELAVETALAAGAAEAERLNASLVASTQAGATLSAQVAALEADAHRQAEEMAVLMAHLQEARRPVQAIEAEVKRLTDDLAAKTLTLEAVTEENRNLRLAMERTRGALEEREFLIRRLERSETNNANVLGRIQTSIERLGGAGSAAGAAQSIEPVAELARIDGQHNTSYPLSKRTRIGRAPGCELRVDSSSVSRHHALLLIGQRDAIIEDLNSTNGVLVNGRKISRQALNDGDMLTIGEAQFRFTLTLAPRVLEAPAAE